MKTLTTLFLLLSTIAMGQTKDIGKYMDSICKHTFIGCFILIPEKMPLINPYKSCPDDTLLLRQKRLNQRYHSSDTVKHIKCRCLIFDEKTHSLKQDSTHDMWVKGDSVHVGAFNPFKNKN